MSSFMNAPVNEDHAAEPMWPVLQFRRGDLTNENELLKRGCWQGTVDNFGPIIGDAWPTVSVTHGGGTVLQSYLLGEISVAVLAVKKLWFTYENESAVYHQCYVDGARSRFRVLAHVKELCDLDYQAPVMISVAGMNAKHLETALREFKKEVINTASRLAKRRFPDYAFFCPLGVADKSSTRQNQYITPPKLNLTGKLDREALDALYVGDELLGLAASLYDEAQNWAKIRQSNDNSAHSDDTDIDEEAF